MRIFCRRNAMFRIFLLKFVTGASVGKTARQDWTGLVSAWLNWSYLFLARLNWSYLVLACLDCTGLVWSGLVWSGLVWSGLFLNRAWEPWLCLVWLNVAKLSLTGLVYVWHDMASPWLAERKFFKTISSVWFLRRFYPSLASGTAALKREDSLKHSLLYSCP